MTINVIVTFGAMLVTMGIGVILTYPDVAIVPILGVIIALAVTMPVIIFPMTYSIWLAVDLFMRKLEPEELADAAAAVASGAAARKK